MLAEYPELWLLTNKKRSLASQLMQFLKNTGYGSALTNYPALIVLLHQLPEEVRLSRGYVSEDRRS